MIRLKPHFTPKMITHNLFSRQSLLLGFLFCLLLLALLPKTRHYDYREDDFDHLDIARQIPSHPEAGWNIEQKDYRRHPVFNYFLAGELSLFGLRPPFYFLINLLIHFLNALAVTHLAKRLGAGEQAASFAGALFLCTSAFYNILIKMTGTLELIALFLFIQTVLAWFEFLRTNSGFSYFKVFAFQILGLLTYEVAVIFPLLAFYILYYAKSKSKFRISLLFLVPLCVISFILLWFLLQDFFASPTVPQKITSLSFPFLIQ